MAGSATYKQEMPRSGGYGPVNWGRKIPNSRIKGWHYILVGTGLSCVGRYIWIQKAQKTHQLALETHEARVALTPFMVAERNRLYLKQIRKNRDDEAALMGDIDGWQVGKLWDEPVYHHKYSSDWTDPSLNEYHVHANQKKAYFKQFLTRWFTDTDNYFQDPS